MEKEMEKINTYQKWLEQEGLPIIRDYSVHDLMTVQLKSWLRKGGNGVYINLVGSEGNNDAYICEIPPGGSLKPQKHLFEEFIYILGGRGATSIWTDGGSRKQTFEWQEGSLFSPPLNTWHQHFNGQGDKSVRYIGVTLAPVSLNLFNDLNFVFNNSYAFKGRFDEEADYFSSEGKSYPRWVWESNFVPNIRLFKLQDCSGRGANSMTIKFQMSDTVMNPHVSEFPVGTYKKAHRHGPGAHIVVLSGKGYSLIWPEGGSRIRVDWKVNSLFSPPDRWFHQHFNIGKEPARYLAIKAGGSPKYRGIAKNYEGEKDVKLGGDQIEYQDEDPEIRRLFKGELAREGAEWRMSPFFPGE